MGVEVGRNVKFTIFCVIWFQMLSRSVSSVVFCWFLHVFICLLDFRLDRILDVMSVVFFSSKSSVRSVWFCSKDLDLSQVLCVRTNLGDIGSHLMYMIFAVI